MTTRLVQVSIPRVNVPVTRYLQQSEAEGGDNVDLGSNARVQWPYEGRGCD